MRHLLITFFIIIGTAQTGHAQRPYLPMVVEGATWIQSRADDQFGFELFFGYRIMGDSAIQGTSYKKLYVMPTNFSISALDLQQKTLVGLLREDTLHKKVFYRNASVSIGLCPEIPGEEKLLYDFDVKVGDTTHLCLNDGQGYPDTVISISRIKEIDHGFGPDKFEALGLDSILRIEIGPNSFFRNEYFEAVGEKMGIVRYYPGIPGTTSSMAPKGLIKYCRHDSLCNLQLLTSREPLLYASPAMRFYPSVVQPGATLTNQHNHIHAASLVEISTGKFLGDLTLIPGPANTLKTKIPLSCKPGMYLLRSRTREGTRYSQKVIVR